MPDAALATAPTGIPTPPTVPIPKFFVVPKELSILVPNGSYDNYCDFVEADDRTLVLVGVFRNRYAEKNVPYIPPALSYLDSAVRPFIAVQYGDTDWRLPADQNELHTLLAALAT